jgi:hypothetical protein
MTEGNLFERLQNKLSALHPSEEHRVDDWAALEAQLDKVLPQEKKRRRPFIIPLFLLTTLLLSNGIWWWKHNKSSIYTQKIENQVNTLQKAFDSVVNKPVITRTDTVWRTIYIEKKTAHTLENISNFNKNTNNYTGNIPFSMTEKMYLTNSVSTVIGTEQRTVVFSKGVETGISTTKMDSNLVKKTRQNVFSTPKLPTEQHLLAIEKTPIISPLEIKPITIIEKHKSSIFKIPTLKLGLKADYLNPRSTGLTAQNGIGIGIQGAIGFTKHLSIIGAMGMARFNYTATNKDAILGSPEELPALANQPNTSIQMHMKNQGCMHYDLSLRYTFNPIAQVKPFIGIGFGGMVLSPYQMDLEVRNIQTMMVQQSNFQVTPKMQQQQMIHLSSGFDIPISRRLSFSFEGYYMRQWKKTVALSPDFIGIRTGVHYGF